MTSCDQRRRLAEQFAIAAREYSEAVAQLVQQAGPPSQTEHSVLRSVMIEAHDRCESAGVEFERHVATHGCSLFASKSHFAESAHVTADARA